MDQKIKTQEEKDRENREGTGHLLLLITGVWNLGVLIMYLAVGADPRMGVISIITLLWVAATKIYLLGESMKVENYLPNKLFPSELAGALMVVDAAIAISIMGWN